MKKKCLNVSFMCMLLLCGMPFGKAETTAPLSEELNFQLKEVKPAANPDKALITLDVQENTAERESPGVAIFFDADHTAYGREIPTGYQYTFYQGSAVPEDTISVFEYALPAGSVADANDSTDWIPAFSSGSMELEPGIYDYCVLRPEMENFDMIGRNNNEAKPRHVVYFYTAGKPVFEQWLKNDIQQYNLKLEPDYRAWDKPVGGSDNSSFAKLEIPILWSHTDGHPDYHMPGDETEKINWDKLTDITKASFLGLWKMANKNF